jgi:hypothetical protein
VIALPHRDLGKAVSAGVKPRDRHADLYRGKS